MLSPARSEGIALWVQGIIDHHGRSVQQLPITADELIEGHSYSRRRRTSRSEPTTASSKALSCREASPAKNRSDLLLASRPVRFYSPGEISTPADVDELDRQLHTVQAGICIVPDAIKAQVRDKHGQELYEHWLDRDATASEGELLGGAAERAWNDEVPSAMIRAALHPDRGICHQNITTAEPCAESMDKSTSGSQQGSKPVKHSVNIEHSSKEIERRMLSLLSRQREDVQTIDKTGHAPIRLGPAAFSIQIKSADGDYEQALTQLGSWSATHFVRLRSLLRDGLPLPTHPVLLLGIQGLTVFFAIDSPALGEISLVRAVDLGPAHTVVDMYKHFAALRVLRDWAAVDYRTWVEEVLLGDGNLAR